MTIVSDSDLLVIKIVDGAPDGFPLTYSNFRMIHPQTSFPELPENSFLVNFGYYRFQYVTRPVAPAFTNINEGILEFDAENDAWSNTWVETPFSTEQMAQASANAMNSIRTIRNNKLLKSDFSQLPDVPFTEIERAAWVVYRQELRDYMSLVTDPFNPPQFPVAPEN